MNSCSSSLGNTYSHGIAIPKNKFLPNKGIDILI